MSSKRRKKRKKNTDGSKGVVAEIELHEAGLGRHDAAGQVNQGRRDLGFHPPGEHVLPVGPPEFGPDSQGLS